MVHCKSRAQKDTARCKAIRLRLAHASWDQEAIDEWCSTTCLACFDPNTKFAISAMERDGGEEDCACG